MTKTRLLIVDDDEDIRTQMKWALTRRLRGVHRRRPRGAMAAFTANHPAVTAARPGTAAAPQRTRRRPGGAVGGCSR